MTLKVIDNQYGRPS